MVQSYYYRLTEEIMLEYRTDRYAAVTGTGRSQSNVPDNYYIYKGLDGGIYYTETCRYPRPAGADIDARRKFFKNQAVYLKMPSGSNSQQFIYADPSSRDIDFSPAILVDAYSEDYKMHTGTEYPC